MGSFRAVKCSEDHTYFYLQLQLMSLSKLLKNQSERNSHISNEYNTITLKKNQTKTSKLGVKICLVRGI